MLSIIYHHLWTFYFLTCAAVVNLHTERTESKNKADKHLLSIDTLCSPGNLDTVKQSAFAFYSGAWNVVHVTPGTQKIRWPTQCRRFWPHLDQIGGGSPRRVCYWFTRLYEYNKMVEDSLEHSRRNLSLLQVWVLSRFRWTWTTCSIFTTWCSTLRCFSMCFSGFSHTEVVCCFLFEFLILLLMWIEPCQGPRPSDFVIERSLDNGTTWKPALYLATDCQKVFPDIATALPIRLDEPHCVTLPPTAENPFQDQNVRFFVLFLSVFTNSKASICPLNILPW